MIIQNVIRFIATLLLQGLIFNQIGIGAYLFPMFYVYYILMLPFETKGWVLLITSFLLGLGVDFFSNSLGLHSTASLCMAFFRPGVIRLLTVGKDYETLVYPSIKKFGFSWFFSYTVILVIIHHTIFFILEVFSFYEIRQIIFRILISSIATIFLIFITQLLFLKREKH
ncbi:MAG TPA: rod shape-determining protein MreD [Bacteroidales bacterium]|nr:rod shape-determining protein MreD [Bacteroidales bacterium]HQH14174.1 rod shape-determining protein MreD [Bacteroidales bacterium]